MQRLKKRSEFVKVARGQRTPRRGFLLQSLPRDEEAGAGPARFGFTVTKKIGNAVVRNRIRRRLREAIRLKGALVASPGTDYVLIGRPPAFDQPFEELLADVVGAIKASARSRGGPAGHSRREEKRPVDG